MVPDQRPAAGLEQGLGGMVRERPHALAAAGGEDHGGAKGALLVTGRG